MIKGLIDISLDRDAFAMRIFHIFKLQCAKDDEWSTVTIRVGIWRFFTSISFTYCSDKDRFNSRGIS